MRFSNIFRNNFIRSFTSGQNGVKSPDPLKNVVGLSKLCVETNEQRQVSGTGKFYKNPEYFGYNRISYAQAEVEMENLRNPQPKAPRK